MTTPPMPEIVASTSFTFGEPVGILRGSAAGDTMDVVAPFLEDPPVRGDFLVVPHPDGTRALVLRIVSAHAGGSFAEGSERGAEYLARLATSGKSVPARVRELLLRYRMGVEPLGWLPASGSFMAGVRDLQLFGYPVWRPSIATVERLVNARMSEGDVGVRIGVASRGHDDVKEVSVRFSVSRLRARRTFVFARAGYGKSNLVKLLVSRLYDQDTATGLLIVDPEGEYAFGHPGGTGKRISGLSDHTRIRDRLLVFTARKPDRLPAQHRQLVGGAIKIDFAKLSPDEFLDNMVSEEKRGQVWSNWIRAAGTSGWRQLIQVLRTQGWKADADAIRSSLGISGEKKSEDVSVSAIRNNLLPRMKVLDDPQGIIEPATSKLLGGGVVVLDTSTLASADADVITRVLLSRLFSQQQEAFTDGSEGKAVLLLLEEAQTVLGGARLDDRDIYVRWVKEGRKYGLGCLLVTQQPGAITPELVSQGDNFFAMHLLADRDLRTLALANAHFTPEIIAFLRDEPVKGNCYFWSAPDQPYVVAVRVDNYDDIAPPAPVVAPGPPALFDAVVQTLAHQERVWLYRVTKVNGTAVVGVIAVADAYLAQQIIGSHALRDASPHEWEETSMGPRLRDAALMRVVDDAGLLVHGGRGRGVLASADRRVVLLSESRLHELAGALGLAVKALRPGDITVTGV